MTPPLNELPFGTRARVTEVTGALELRVSLLELGIVPGAEVELVRSAPLGDPVELRVGRARLALRREALHEIQVEAVA